MSAGTSVFWQVASDGKVTKWNGKYLVTIIKNDLLYCLWQGPLDWGTLLDTVGKN